MQRVPFMLLAGGSYVVVSYGHPDTRVDHFRRKKLHWEACHGDGFVSPSTFDCRNSILV